MSSSSSGVVLCCLARWCIGRNTQTIPHCRCYQLQISLSVIGVGGKVSSNGQEIEPMLVLRNMVHWFRISFRLNVSAENEG